MDNSNGLVVDDRVLPDSDLPTDFVEGVLDIANYLVLFIVERMSFRKL